MGVLLFQLGVWLFLAAVQCLAPDYFLAAAAFAGASAFFDCRKKALLYLQLISIGAAIVTIPAYIT